MDTRLPLMSMLSIEHPKPEVTTDTTWRKLKSSFNIFLCPLFSSLVPVSYLSMHTSCHLFGVPRLFVTFCHISNATSI